MVLPWALQGLDTVAMPGIMEAMTIFFAREDFRVSIDPSCVANAILDEDDFTKSYWNPGKVVMTHAKWSAEAWLPLVIRRSKWFAPLGYGNATIVAYRSRTTPRHELSRCREFLERESPRWNRSEHWFLAFSSRGPCCDGGQARDPGLMTHHFLTHAGERSGRDRWLFREARFADLWRRASQYKAPASRDTSPHLRCFDSRKDVSLPPPVWLVRADGSCGPACRSFPVAPSPSRDILVFHAEGTRGGMEYDIRRDMTLHWDWTWTSKNPEEEERRRRVGRPRDDRVFVRFSTDAENYTWAMTRSKFCIISEGYSPWSPRLTEAVGFGCVPAILSPTYLPPYPSLNWTKFSVVLERADIPVLPEVLERYDHAELFRNLLLVRHLFAFCIDQGGQDGCGGLPKGDGLPLVIFELAARNTPPERRTSPVSLLRSEGEDVLVDYACDDRGSCVFDMDGNERWRCDVVNRNACECRRRRSDGRFEFAGTTAGLVGHKSYLWAS